jgi:iron complex transport system permease protein
MKRRLILLPALLFALGLSALAALSWGVQSLDPSVAVAALFGNADQTLTTVVQQIRAPRIVMALVVGALLGIAGAVSQGLFANPLAEPTIIGVASGAAVGLLVAVALGVATIGSVGAVIAAVVGAMIVAAAISLWDRRGGDPLSFLLAGIAFAAVGNALVGLITATAGRGDLRSISFWSLGSLSLSTWSGLGAIAAPATLGVLLAIGLAKKLDYLALGRLSARHLGVNVRNAQMLSFLALALLIGSAVAVVGIIAFVGLVVPHVVRLLVGPRHRPLLAFSALVGALLVLIADTAARTLFTPIEIPIGLLTAIIGAPVLLVLLKAVRST